MKAKRSTKAELAARDASIIEILREDHPQSVRHLFYRMTDPSIPGHVEKTESGYRRIQDRAVKLRLSRAIPYGWIADHGRSAHWHEGFDGVLDFMRSYQSLYRRSLWQDASERVEVWCEARSMTGVLNPVCEEYQVPLFPSGGYSSLSFLHDAAQSLSYSPGPVTVYHIGDYDDDGLQIGRDIERKLPRFMREFTGEPPPFRFVRLAVNEGQIRDFNLPSKPAKASRGKEVKYTVEAEAVPAWRMREWLKAALASHLDADALSRAEAVEREERQSLTRMAKLFEQVGQGDVELLARKGIDGYDEYRAEYTVGVHGGIDHDTLRVVRPADSGAETVTPITVPAAADDRVWHCSNCCRHDGNCREWVCRFKTDQMIWHTRKVHGLMVDNCLP